MTPAVRSQKVAAPMIREWRVTAKGILEDLDARNPQDGCWQECEVPFCYTHAVMWYRLTPPDGVGERYRYVCAAHKGARIFGVSL